MYAVLNLRWKPHEFTSLPDNERAFVIACIKKRIEDEEKAYKNKT